MKLTTYRDVDIEVTEGGYFRIAGGALPREATGFTNLKDLQKEINRLLAAQAKSRTLDLPVIDGMGNIGKLTGLHLGTSHVTTKGCDEAYMFPHLPWIEAKIKEMNLLRHQMQALREQLQPFVLKSRFGYGRLSPDEYGEQLTKVEEEYATKLAEAAAGG